MTWRELSTTGPKPLPRAGHVAVTVGRYMVVFGGFTDDRRLFNDLHVLDLGESNCSLEPPMQLAQGCVCVPIDSCGTCTLEP